MIRSLFTLFFVTCVGPVWAQCVGNDLLAALPNDEQAALRAQAETHPYPNGILWRATRGDQEIHLVGTMHFHEARHAATFEQVKPWIDAADTVFLELGEGDEAKMQHEITANPSLAFIIDGPTLPELMVPEEWDKLKEAMLERGTPGFMTAKMKPWMALISLSITKCVMSDVVAGKRGLDQTIIDYAAEIGNPARALEPYDTALKLFGSYSDEEMLHFLRFFLAMENFSPDDQHHTLVEAYFREEIRILWEWGLVQSLAQPMGQSKEKIIADYARLEDALINARNRAWMDRILPAVETGSVFLAAGALHMPGEQGVLRLLEKEGFQVERIARN